MLTQLRIENFKSIEKLSMELGRINVLIGENGSGKSNILEAIAFAAAAAGDKLDNEFLASRGIRMTEPQFMRSAFDSEARTESIHISLKGDPVSYQSELSFVEKNSLFKWVDLRSHFDRYNFREARATIAKTLESSSIPFDQHQPFTELVESFSKLLEGKAELGPIYSFLVYSPENTALRTFQSEGQILPVGIKGEGLFAHLKALAAQSDHSSMSAIIDKLSLIDWFKGFEIPADLVASERALRIQDRYLAEGALFDQRSANEGFLFLLFYFTLFISPATPKFFAVDNIDASLNPKLCQSLTEELVRLAKQHDKQAILTTHNPAILDGLDLHDDEQRLFVIHRNSHGHTKARRIQAPKSLDGQPPMKLSEAFLRGHIGGLPKNF